VYVYAYVYVYVYAYVYVYVYNACMCMRMRICMCMCMCICIRMCLLIFTTVISPVLPNESHRHHLRHGGSRRTLGEDTWKYTCGRCMKVGEEAFG
jgi:hypothetical protein